MQFRSAGLCACLIAASILVVGNCSNLQSREARGEDARVLKVFKPGNRLAGVAAVAPSINNRGQIVFGFNGTDRQSIWSSSTAPNSDAQEIVKVGDPIPGLEDATFVAWKPCTLNDAGQFAVVGSYMSDGNTHSNGIWCYDPAQGFELVAKDGLEALSHHEDTDETESSDVKIIAKSIMDQSGKTVVLSELLATANDQFPTAFPGQNNGCVLWERNVGDELHFLTKLPSLKVVYVAGNENGDVLLGPVSDSKKMRVSLRTQGITLPLFGFETPVTVPQQKGILLRAVSSPSLNNAQEVAMQARIAGSDRRSRNATSALLRYDLQSGLRADLYEGMPRGDARFLDVNMNAIVVINQVGTVLCCTGAYANPSSHSVVVCPKNGKPIAVAVWGETAPGTQATFSVTSSEYSSDTQSFSDPVINARDQVAFLAHLSIERKIADTEPNLTPFPKKKDTTPIVGIWATRPGAKDLTLIAKTNDEIEIAPGDRRKIAKLFFAGATGNEDCRPSGMNDRGDLVYAVEFQDGSTAVLHDSTVASGTIEVATNQNVAKEASQDALDDLEAWEKLADARVATLKSEYEKSDYKKLSDLADEMRASYQRVQTELVNLTAGQRRMDRVAYETRLKQLRDQAVLLPKQWKAIAEREYHDDTIRSGSDDREFASKTASLLRDYGSHPAVKERVANKAKDLEAFSQRSIDFVASDQPLHARIHLRHFGKSGRVLKLFSGSIGPKTPNLLPDKPTWTAPDFAVKDGVLVAVREPVSRLIKIKLKADGRLNFDESHWNDDSVGLSEGDIMAQVDRMLLDRGVGETLLFEEHELRIRQMQAQAGQNIRQMRGSLDLGPVALFDEIKRVASKHSGQGGSSGSSGGGSSNNYQRRFTTETLRGAMTGGDSGFELSLTELTGDQRKLEFRWNKNGRLQIQIESEDSFGMLLQHPTGALLWVYGIGPDTITHSFMNFAEFCREKNDYVRNNVLNFLSAYGIFGPASWDSSKVRELVVDELRGRTAEVQASAKAAIANLDSETFQTRQMAAKELAENVTRYHHVLQEALKAPGRSLESSVQIKRLLDFEAQQTNEFQDLITALRITDSPTFLKALIDGVSEDDRKLIESRIQELGVKKEP